MRMVKCPQCKGTGEAVLTVVTVGEKKEEKIKINCPMCKGKKRVSDTKLKELKEVDKIWCKCKEPTFGSYPEDGQCTCGIHKHHVHCGTCGKVSQIG